MAMMMMMIAKPTDLSMLENEEYKSIFYQKDGFSDLNTVAFSIVVINGDSYRAEFQTKNSKKGHAEIAFIENVTKVLGGQGANIEITINLSKSPCFTCREDLENFFDYLRVNRGARVIFTLRIANLYFGDGGGKDEIIEDLVSWLCHLNRENIVHTLVIQPILVVTEIRHYRPRGVSDDEWEQIQGKMVCPHANFLAL